MKESIEEFNKRRLLECLTCEFMDVCVKYIKHPEDNIDGTCKTKNIFIENMKNILDC